AIVRRHHGRVAEQPDLATVGMARKRERDATGNAGKNIRLVSQQNDGRAVRHLGEHARQIVDAAKTLAAFPADNKSKLIAKSREPEWRTVVFKAHDIVLKHRNADVFQREPAEDRPFASSLGGSVLPPVVIAKDSVDSQPRLQALQRL